MIFGINTDIGSMRGKIRAQDKIAWRDGIFQASANSDGEIAESIAIYVAITRWEEKTGTLQSINSDKGGVGFTEAEIFFPTGAAAEDQISLPSAKGILSASAFIIARSADKKIIKTIAIHIPGRRKIKG